MVEDREVGAAALMLLSLSHVEVDQKTAQDMEQIRNEAIRSVNQRRRLAAPVHAIKGHRPWLPPVPALEPFIGKCSRPIEKQLETSDVKDNQSRLSLKRDSVIKEFLPILNRSCENVKNGIEVVAYDSYGNKYEKMKLKLWADKMYVLTKEWKQFSQDYKLVNSDDAVKVWMFRDNRTDKLSVVITPILDETISVAERDRRRVVLNKPISSNKLDRTSWRT